MADELKGKSAVVTGGSRGIGRGITEAFLAAGANVMISGTGEDKGKRALEEMQAGDACTFQRADARQQADTERLIDAAIDRYGAVDILVNNAGGSGGFALIGDMSDEAWNQAGDWILNSAFWATRRALRSMVASGWGRVISISSVESKTMQTPMAAHYATFKLALNGFTRCVAVEYATSGITANAICPGGVETDLTRTVGADNAAASGITYGEFLENYAQASLTKKLNTVEEIAAVALLLASPAGAGITGTSINVDGGTAPF
jgi:3-hydroxybutyrate dehydrogenase/3-oxoacyl-[acyl-carrier protein] reductase